MTSPGTSSSGIKVSVVVPVFNAGGHLERSAASLLTQTLSPQEYEVIYVDDGSTDDSAERLAELAASHPHVVVITQPGSGWPGRPRNVGIDAARGVYVQFVDQDDRLGPEALERLWALAGRELPDIVLGKMGGGMSSPNLLFRRTVPWGDLSSIPAIDSLTAHKMFRRQFLLEHDIRFPEGYWRGEDLLFMARAYARSPSMAVLADYVCYYWDRHDTGNNSRAPYDLVGHYDRLRQIIAALRDGTTPGALQDRLLRRLYRVEVMARLKPFPSEEPVDEEVERTFALSRAVALESFPPGVRDGMPGAQKLRATLLERGDLEEFNAFNHRVVALGPPIQRDVTVLEDGSLRAHLRVGLHLPHGKPLTVVRRADRWLLDPALVGPAMPGAELEIDDPLGYAHGEIRLFDPDREVWWYPEGDLTPFLREVAAQVYEPVAEGDLVVDPQTAAAGLPLEPGDYWVWVVWELLGVARSRRLVVPAGVEGLRSRWTARSPRQLVRWDWSLDGRRLRLQVRDRRRWLAQNVRAGDVPPSLQEKTLAIPVTLASAHAPAADPVRLTLHDADVRAALRGVLRVDASGRRAEIELRTRADVPDGDYDVSFGSRSSALARVSVEEGRIDGLTPVGQAEPEQQEVPAEKRDLRSWVARLRPRRR